MKITLSRVFETSKALASKAGQDLTDFIDFMAQMSEQVLRALRNNLTFEDNMRCITQRVNVKNGELQIINIGNRSPNKIMLTRVYSSIHAVDSFLWFINNSNQLVVRCGFTDNPNTDNRIDIDLLIFYN
jgi:hypothetical protein